MLRCVIVLSLISWAAGGCYWNAQCPYKLYSTKTPYDTIRGDIRDQPSVDRSSVTDRIKVIAGLKDQIVESFDTGRSQLCSQDIEEFRKWRWNDTLEVSQSFLTGTGYEELYDIAKRLRERYPHLLQGSDDQYYFRSTNEQRTVTSGMAFVHGLAEGTNLNLTVDGPWERDDVIRPYQNCDRYQKEVKGGQKLQGELKAYFDLDEFKTVRNNVQKRLGIETQLSSDDIYSLYEICRFYRSWTATKQSPWCSVFTDEDLVVLEYRDDVRHYYRNGYGSWVNVNLGGPVLKDLYENFEAVINGEGRNVVSYFTHDAMMQMAFSAMGLYNDSEPIKGSERNPDRVWKTSYIASFSVNFIAVLNSCQESGAEKYRVQFFVNELVTDLCPFAGCTWEHFQDNFQKFTNSNLDFCTIDNNEAVAPMENVAVILSNDEE